MARPVSRTLPLISTLLLAGTLLSAPALAAPVEVTFLPPEIPAQEVCVAKKADPDVVARWRGWDGTSPLEGNPDDVLRDARRLRDLNPTGNFELVDKMLVAASKMGAPKAPDVTIDRVNLYLKAGKVPQLRELGIIDGLEANAGGLAPKALNLLAGLYIDGLVVKKDQDKGLGYLTQAAMGGNADALLRLAGMNTAGTPVPGWDLDPKLAVTMAFGALVGKLDPEICDRIGRIAREYSKGNVVKQDHTIAEQWLRLAADLGDASAAWKVAQLHLESELIVKNNDRLLKYLAMAADKNVAAAKVELGKLYEAGALLPQDKTKAETLYEEASKLGSRNGLFRLATLLEEEQTVPGNLARYKAALTQLTDMPSPPGWAFSKLADVVLAEKGRWAGESEAQALLEKGVALEDADSAQALASILLRHRDEPGVFERATELLGFAVTDAGKIDPMTDLRQAYLCRAPKGADLRLASFWQLTEDAAGNSTEFMDNEAIAGLDAATDPIELARLQTHALYGRPNSVAYYVDYLQRNGASPEMLDFWQARIAPVTATLDAQARHRVNMSPTPEVIDEAIAQLQRARADGLPRASVDLGSLLLDYFPNDPARKAEAIGYLEEGAAQGQGEAILRLLPLEEEAGTGSADTLLARYQQAIEERGDADALLFAASTSHDIAQKRDYLYRAASVVDCTFENTIKLAGAFVDTEDDAETEHWLQVSLRLAGEDGWRHVAIGDRYMAMGGPDRARTAIALYQDGVKMGDDTAVGRLVKIYADPDGADYAPTKAVEMFKRMIDDAQVADLGKIRDKVEKSPPAIRTAVMAEVDWSARYAAAAASGDAVAMRELGLYLRDSGTPSDARDASGWLKRAADGGDVVAMVELAKAYAMGIGIQPSIQQAQVLLKDAAGLGNEEAQRLLASMAVEN
jgi:TPR repeat protein